ncbi:MAG: hypothetical protein IPN74_09480 [Haliscomenobacter sp.]|nr:hypothetical protein [Haliscomenobacter sp.]
MILYSFSILPDRFPLMGSGFFVAPGPGELAEIKRVRLRHKNLDRKKEIGALYGRGNTKEKVLSTIDKPFIEDTPHDTRKEIAADLG